MNKIVKKALVLLKLFLQTVISLLRVLKNRIFSINTTLPRALEKDIFILGNGPSLKNNLEQDLDFLKPKKIFSVNNFCLSESFSIIQPDYYILLDPAFYIQKNTSSKFLELQQSIFTSLHEKVSWPITLFIPRQTDMMELWNGLSNKNENIDIKYINTDPVNGFKKIIFFLYKNNYAMPPAQNVLIAAIFLSLNMGYENIYLLGADHSWTEDLRVNNKNQLYIFDKHFYGSEEKLFYKGPELGEIWKMNDILMAWARTFEGYFVLEEYSTYLQKNIYNLTQNSYIDAFVRTKIEDLY